MKEVIEIALLIVTITNKVTVIGIAVWTVWALQTIFLDHRWVQAYPFLGRIPARFALALIAAGFAIDAFSVYVPSMSEVVMNAGIFIGMHLFRIQYKRNQGEHFLLDISRRKQNSRI